MNLAERRKFLRLLQPDYRAATQRQENSILTGAERLTQLHRKSLIRLVAGDLRRRPRRRLRGGSYGPEVESAVRLIASAQLHCAQRGASVATGCCAKG
jgi:hypothetical protein